MENTKYGRRRERRWTSIRAKAQDTRANPNSWKTHLVRKRWDIGLLRALSPRIMMMIAVCAVVYVCTMYVWKYVYMYVHVCVYVWMYVYFFVCMYVCMHICMYVCMPACIMHEILCM